MGSDNPKGAVAKVSPAASAGKYAGIAAAVVVLYVCLSTSPSTTVPGVDGGANTPRGAGGAGGDGASASGGRRAGDGRGGLTARNAKAVGVGGLATAAADDERARVVTAQALPIKLGGGGGGGHGALSAGAGVAATATGDGGKAGDPLATGLYALRTVDIDGVDTSLGFLQGKVTLVVNVASE